MKRLRHFFALGAGLMAAVAAAADKPAPPKPGAPTLPAARFKQVRDRANALFAVRNQSPAAPVPAENPLRSAGDAAARPRGTQPGVAPAELSPTELDLLQQAVATLRVSGTFEKDGESYFVINSKPYRVGDVVQTIVDGEAAYLRVREITRNGVTLAMGESEVTLKYPVRTSPKPAR